MAGKVLPKLSVFLFFSVVSILINFSICLVVAMDTGESDIGFYTSSDSYSYGDDLTDDYEVNVSAFNYGLATGGSFIPFFSIVSISLLGLDSFTFIFVSLIFGLIGAIQLIVLVLIGLSFFPNILGSGVDV